MYWMWAGGRTDGRTELKYTCSLVHNFTTLVSPYKYQTKRPACEVRLTSCKLIGLLALLALLACLLACLL